MDTRELDKLRGAITASSRRLDDLVGDVDKLEAAVTLLGLPQLFNDVSAQLQDVRRPLRRADQQVQQAWKDATREEETAEGRTQADADDDWSVEDGEEDWA